MNLNKSHGKHAHGAKKTNAEPLTAKPSGEEAADDVRPASEDDATQIIPPAHASHAKGADDDKAKPDQADADDEDDSSADAPAAGEASEILDIPYVLEPQENQGTFVAAGFGAMPAERRARGLKVFGITLGIIIGVLLIAYLAGAVTFMGRFVPNTVIAGKDVSMLTDEDAAKTLQDVTAGYQLDVVGNGFSYRLAGSDIGLSVDTDAVVSAMHKDLNAWEWPMLLMQPKHDETDRLVIKYQKDAYEPGLTAELDKFNETAKDPVNATIVYDEASKKFVVKPEEDGTKLDSAAVLAAATKAIDALETKVSVGNEMLVQPAVRSTDERLNQAAELASGMVSAHLILYLEGKEVGVVDGTMLSQYVTVNDQYEVTFLEDEMNAWVEEFASGFNTVGTERIYTRPDGKEIAVSGGVYGWEVDTGALKEQILEGIRSGQEVEMGVPCLESAAVYNGPNQPDWGKRYIDVDLSEQYVRFYGDDGAIIWEAPCISGTPDGKHDTGKGVWRVNGKESPSKLIGYEDGKKIYETSVKYWMPFEGNGIGFHDATWQPSFGGSMYANGYGSHGCVNLSYSDAESLYGIIKFGDVVIVHG